MRAIPLCRKCETRHYNMNPCPTGPPVERQRPVFRVVRPREGFREYGDALEPSTVRMGESTFALRREPGERHGGFRAALGDAA